MCIFSSSIESELRYSKLFGGMCAPAICFVCAGIIIIGRYWQSLLCVYIDKDTYEWKLAL